MIRQDLDPQQRYGRGEFLKRAVYTAGGVMIVSPLLAGCEQKQIPEPFMAEEDEFRKVTVFLPGGSKKPENGSSVILLKANGLATQHHLGNNLEREGIRYVYSVTKSPNYPYLSFFGGVRFIHEELPRILWQSASVPALLNPDLTKDNIL